MTNVLNVEPRSGDDRTISRPRSTIYGEIRDRVFGAKQAAVSSKPASPFAKFEPLTDETGKKSPVADFTGSTGRLKHADAVSENTSDRTSMSAVVFETSQLPASESYVTVPPVTLSTQLGFSSTTPQTKDVDSKVESRAQAVTRQVPSSSHMSSKSVVGTVSVSMPSQLSGHQQRQQQTAVTTSGTHQQRDEADRQVNATVGRALTTKAEVHPWNQAHLGSSSQQKLDPDIAMKVETPMTPAVKAEMHKVGAGFPSSTTAGFTTSQSVLPAVSVSSVQTNRGKIVPSPTSRIDWAKQRFGGPQSSDSGMLIPDSSPKLKHRTFTVAQPELHVSDATLLGNLDESISMLSAAAAATRVVTVQEHPRPLQAAPASSTVVPPLSTAAVGSPFKPLTVSPPITVSSRVAIVHGLQMSPPASTTTAPKTATEPDRSPALTSLPLGAGKLSGSLAADVRLATRTKTESSFQSATSIAAPSSCDWRSAGRSDLPAARVAVQQRSSPAVVHSSAFMTSPVQSNVSSTSVLPTAVATCADARVISVPSVSRPHVLSTVVGSANLTPQAQTHAPTFSIEKPVVSPVLAKPALPTITARVWKPEVPQIQLIAQPLKSVVVMQSPVPESRLIPVVPSTSAMSQKSLPDTTTQVSAREDTVEMYLNSTRQVVQVTQALQMEAQKISATSHVSVSQAQHVSTSPHRTQVAITPRKHVQTLAELSRPGLQQAQSRRVPVSQVQASKPIQQGHVASLQIQATASAQPSHILAVEALGQVQPTRVGVAQTETRSASIKSGTVVVPATPVVEQRGIASQTVGDARTRQNEQPRDTLGVPDRRVVDSSSVAAQITQAERQQLTLSSSGVGVQRRGGTAAVDDEVDRALRALDSIVAETRSLSTSLSRTTTMPSTATTTTVSRVQTSQVSTAVVVGSQRDNMSAPDEKRRLQKSPSSRLQSAPSLDSSGIIKKHLVHLENIFRPGGASDAQVKKSVQLRKPRPLRKAQTVDLTAHGIGVDPELMQLLQTRKEKSASDDEDSAAKQRDDVVSVRYCHAVAAAVIDCSDWLQLAELIT